MVAVPKLLITAATGSQDPTRASIPFHIAVNGVAAAGFESGVALAGDATELLKPEVREAVRGVGVPPHADLFAACRDKGVAFYVLRGCAEARAVSEQMLESWRATFITPVDLARLSIEADRVLSF
jgi:predicted peroxiredoxin